MSSKQPAAGASLGEGPSLAPAVAAIGRALGQRASAEAVERMARHWLLVAEASAQQNLTGIKSVEAAAEMHYLDACVAADLLLPGSIVDFGSGAGFPGLVFAALDPEREVALVEPRRLRVEFLRAAIASLGCGQVEVIAGKVQGSPPHKFANAVCRAVFSDDADLALAAPWLQRGGRLLSFRAESAEGHDRVGPLRRIDVRPYTVGGSLRRIDVWQLTA